MIGMNQLAYEEHKVISFSQIDPSLVFFHEGESDFFSIITNKERTDQEYVNLCDLKHLQSLDQLIELI